DQVADPRKRPGDQVCLARRSAEFKDPSVRGAVIGSWCEARLRSLCELESDRPAPAACLESLAHRFVAILQALQASLLGASENDALPAAVRPTDNTRVGMQSLFDRLRFGNFADRPGQVNSPPELVELFRVGADAPGVREGGGRFVKRPSVEESGFSVEQF